MGLRRCTRYVNDGVVANERGAPHDIERRQSARVRVTRRQVARFYRANAGVARRIRLTRDRYRFDNFGDGKAVDGLSSPGLPRRAHVVVIESPLVLPDLVQHNILSLSHHPHADAASDRARAMWVSLRSAAWNRLGQLQARLSPEEWRGGRAKGLAHLMQPASRVDAPW